LSKLPTRLTIRWSVCFGINIISKLTFNNISKEVWKNVTTVFAKHVIHYREEIGLHIINYLVEEMLFKPIQSILLGEDGVFNIFEYVYDKFIPIDVSIDNR